MGSLSFLKFTTHTIEISDFTVHQIHIGKFSACLSYVRMYLSSIDAKQKHLGCKKVRGQSEATLQTGRRDQKV